jgi:hypothetical protein
MHLRDIVLHNGMHPLNRPSVMLARAWERFDDNRRLADEQDRAMVRSQLEALRSWTQRLAAA